MRLEDVVVILARPSEPGNVGAVCRAMMNMGLSRLRIVPEPGSRPLDGSLVRARAVHAAGIWEGAAFFPGLEAAVADIPLVVGATRRTGRRRKDHTMTALETAVLLAGRPGPAALVFGNERTGLDDRELRLCNLAAHIPAAGEFPSLNLSHAVQVFCYELYLALSQEGGQDGEGMPEKGRGPREGRRQVPLDQARIGELVRGTGDLLERLGFYRQPGREGQEDFFRDILARAALTAREGEYLAGIFAKAARLARDRAR